MSTTSIVVIAIIVLLVAMMFRGRNTSPADLELASEEDIPGLLMGGRKIDAIKVYRRLHHVDLKAAKEAIDRMATTLPKTPIG